MMTRQKRVVWTDAEIAKVADSIAAKRAADPVESFSTLLLHAQHEVLPADRRRPIANIGRLPKEFFDRIEAKMKTGPPAPPPEVIEVPVVLEQPAAPPDPMEVLRSLPIEIVIGHCVSRLSGQFEALLQLLAKGGTVSNVGPSVPLPFQTEARPPKARKLRIAVVGLLPDQQQAVRNRLNGDVDLYFSKDRSDTGIPPSADAVIVQRHTRHADYHKAIAEKGRDRVAFVSGGISAVVAKVKEFTAQHQPGGHA